MSRFTFGLGIVIFYNAKTGVPIASSGSGSSLSLSEGRSVISLMDNTGRPIDVGEGNASPEISLTLREYMMGFPFITDSDNNGNVAKTAAFNGNILEIEGKASAAPTVASSTMGTFTPGSYIVASPDGAAITIYSLTSTPLSSIEGASSFQIATGNKVASTELVIESTRGWKITFAAAATLPTTGYFARVDIFGALGTYNKTPLLGGDSGLLMGVAAVSEKTADGSQLLIHIHKVRFHSFPTINLSNKEQGEYELTGLPLVKNDSIGVVEQIKT